MTDGVCEKCGWDVDGDDYALVTRAESQCVVCHGTVDAYTGRCDDWLSCPNAR